GADNASNAKRKPHHERPSLRHLTKQLLKCLFRNDGNVELFRLFCFRTDGLRICDNQIVEPVLHLVDQLKATQKERLLVVRLLSPAGQLTTDADALERILSWCAL